MQNHRFASLLFVLLKLTMHLSLLAEVDAGIADDVACLPERVSALESSAKCGESQVHGLSKCDQEICGGDRACIEYHSIASNLQYHPYLKIRDVTALSVERNSFRLSYDQPFAYMKRGLSDCFALTDLRMNLVNESSYSPWEYVINRDENRIPRDILETQCSCLRCLDASRNRVSSHYLTQPVMVTRYFHMRSNGTQVFNAQFSHGCICEYD